MHLLRIYDPEGEEIRLVRRRPWWGELLYGLF